MMKEKAQAKVTKWRANRWKDFAIAKHCGIHPSALSRLMSGNGPVSEETIKKVIEAGAIK